MAAVPLKLIRQTVVNSTPVTYTVATGGCVVTNILLSNNTATPTLMTVTLAGIAVMTSLSVPANQVLSFDMKQPMAAADVVSVTLVSGGASMGVHVCGVQL